MAFRTQKISQMTPKGSDLEATDLIEVSTIESGSYVTRSITGQELIDAIPAPTGFVPTTRTLTINGTTQDLSADRTFTISTGITIGTTAITSGTVGRVLFQGTGNVVQQSSSLFWDSTNDRLTIGTSTGTSKINLPDAGTTASDGIAFGNGANIFKNASSGISLFSGSGTWQFNSAILVLPTNQATFIRMASGRNLLIDNGTTTFASINGTTGNVLINTTTDAGFRLDVNGTARVTSSLRVESSFTALSSATIGGTTLAANAILQVNGSGKYVNYNSSFSSGSFLTYQAFGTWEAIGADSPAGTILAFGGYRASQWTGITLHSNGSERMRIHSTGNVLINTTTDAGFKLDVNGTARVSGQLSSGASGTNGNIGLRRTSDGSIVGSFYTDAAQTIVKEHTGTGGVLLNGFDTTSLKWVGTSSQPRVGIGFNGTINATCHIKGAFATSATSSLLIENSAGTAAMRVRDDLVIILPNLPTSSAGLPTSAIWNDAGTLKIV